MRAFSLSLVVLALTACDTEAPHNASTVADGYADGYDDGYADAKAESDEALAALESRLATVESALAELNGADGANLAELGKLSHYVEVAELDDGHAEVRLTGINLHLRDGSGSTNGSAGFNMEDFDPTGYGNLIIGYNEGDGQDDRTGSHNLIVGAYHSYTAIGSIVAGYDNHAAGPYTLVSGRTNVVSGVTGVAVGGGGHLVEGISAVAVGGYYQTLSKFSTYSTILGGAENTIQAMNSTIVGGQGLSLVTDEQYLSPAD